MRFARLGPALLPTTLVVLGGCGGEPPPAATADMSRPVKTLLIEAPQGGGVRNFPARIDAGEKAELAFRVSGKVQELLVKEGEEVDEGEVVAKLDPRDFEIVVSDRQATYNNASKNFNRAKELIKDGNIAKMDYDRLEAEFRNAQAALSAAKQDLDYTTLQAPFRGRIAKRHIQRFEEVQAKQPVLALQDVDRLEVKFDVPESIIRGIRAGAEEREKARDEVAVFASFEDLPGQQFRLEFKEIATRADAQTQTFEATYTMEQLERRTVLPGMTATVTLDLSVFRDEGEIFRIPVSAVVGDFKLAPRVWVVDQQTMTVTPQSVKVGRLMGDRIEVTEGLETGMRIVVAGASFVTAGMKVTLMPQREQAAPRPGDAG